MVRSERILIRAGIENRDVQFFHIIEAREQDAVAARGVFVVGIARASGEPDFFQFFRIHRIDRNHVPLLMYRPSIEKVVHERSVDHIPDFVVLRLDILFGERAIDGDLRRRGDEAPPLDDQIRMLQMQSVGLRLGRLHDASDKILHVVEILLRVWNRRAAADVERIEPRILFFERREESHRALQGLDEPVERFDLARDVIVEDREVADLAEFQYLVFCESEIIEFLVPVALDLDVEIHADADRPFEFFQCIEFVMILDDRNDIHAFRVELFDER